MSAQGTDKTTTGMAALYLVVFIAFIDTHAQMPILAPYSISLGATPFIVGLIVGIYSFTNIIGNGVSGMAMDRSGWRLPLTIGMLGASISLLGYAWAANTEELLLVRAVHGLAGGLLVPATLMAISSLSDADELRSRMARYGVVIGTAAFIGPMFAGMFASIGGYRATYMILAAGMLISFTVVLAALNTVPRTEAKRDKPLCPIRVTPLIAISFITAFATMGATGTLVSYMPVHGAVLGLSDAFVGMGFAAFALSAVITQMVWPKLFYSRISGAQGCALGIGLLAAALLFLPSTTRLPTLAMAMVLFGIGFGTVFPNMLMLVHAGERACRGRMMALFFVFYSLGVAIVPPLAGFLYETRGLVPTYTSLTFCVAMIPLVLLLSRGVETIAKN